MDPANIPLLLRSDAQVTIISKSDRVVTIINVFTVARDDQKRLVDLLAQATQSSVRHILGFVSAALHRGLDGTKGTMYDSVAHGRRLPADAGP